jgi:hypothetical protein
MILIKTELKIWILLAKLLVRLVFVICFYHYFCLSSRSKWRLQRNDGLIFLQNRSIMPDYTYDYVGLCLIENFFHK